MRRDAINLIVLMAMATVTVRKLADDVLHALKIRAAINGRSTEAEIREILKIAVGSPTVEEQGALVKRKLDPITEHAARVFLQRLEGKYLVREAFLYGSRARGTHTPDSDADIAVILNGERADRSPVVKDMAGIAFHVMMETGVMVEAFPLWRDELEHPGIFRNPALIENIRRDGVRL